MGREEKGLLHGILLVDKIKPLKIEFLNAVVID